jgi:hypothetical protein
VVLLLFEAVRAIFDNVGASAHSTTVGNGFLDHACYLTITYFSATTENKSALGRRFEGPVISARIKEPRREAG